MPISFEDFQSRSRALQFDYIETQRLRMADLDATRLRLASDPWAYKLAAGVLGFHPLSATEIAARLVQLDGMEARVDETHGDTPAMRAVYELHCATIVDHAPVAA